MTNETVFSILRKAEKDRYVGWHGIHELILLLRDCITMEEHDNVKRILKVLPECAECYDDCYFMSSEW